MFLTVRLWLIFKFFLDDQNPTIPIENCVKMSLTYFPPRSHIVCTMGLTSQGKKTLCFLRTVKVVRGTKDEKRDSLKGLSET